MKFTKLYKSAPMIIVSIAFVILFRPIFHGFAPVPFDGLVGTYFPWLNQKYGYVVGVPVKNISVSDVFSQLYPWRTLSLEAFRRLKMPLWNPYSFSGTPLMANWQSAPLYPLNMLMIIFGDFWGWSFMVILQPILALLFLYLFLREIGIKNTSALLGGFIFAFGGFMTTYLEYNTAGQILIWLPLMLLFIEKYFSTQKLRFLCFLSLLIFIVSTGGFFQPALFVYIIFGSYFIYKLLIQKHKHILRYLVLGIVFVTLGFGLSAIQLLPVIELLKLSIRNVDNNIFEYQYGLLPIKNIITFIAPDFFGNPATFNFWGFMQYQETSGYFGVVSLALVLAGTMNTKFKQYKRFFIVVFIISLLLAFRNPLSLLVYTLKIPLISTGYASRWLMITPFAVGILAAIGLESDRNQIRRGVIATAILTIFIFICIFLSRAYLGQNVGNLPVDFTNILVASRNTILPTMLTLALICGLFIRNRPLLTIFIFILLIFDLGRFSNKFLPFSPLKFITSETNVSKFLKSNVGYNRIEKESGPLLPSNTWIYDRLQSPSGYDPLITKQYATWYRVYNSLPSASEDPLDRGSFTRYLNWTEYNSPFIDLASVKFLLVLKRDKTGVVDKNGKQFYYSFPTTRFNKVFEDGAVVVFDNPHSIPRVSLYDQFETEQNYADALLKIKNGFDYYRKIILDDIPPEVSFRHEASDTVEITKYEPNNVYISAKTKNRTILMLTDSYYPGWNAIINDKPTKIFIADGIYRAVVLPAGDSNIVFSYNPQSFASGLKVTLLSFFGLMAITIILSRLKWTND